MKHRNKRLISFFLASVMLIGTAASVFTVTAVDGYSERLQMEAPKAQIVVDGVRDNGYGRYYDINNNADNPATAKACFAWSDTHVYMYIEVKDATYNTSNTDSNIWNNDRIRWHIDLSNKMTEYTADNTIAKRNDGGANYVFDLIPTTIVDGTTGTSGDADWLNGYRFDDVARIYVSGAEKTPFYKGGSSLWAKSYKDYIKYAVKPLTSDTLAGAGGYIVEVALPSTDYVTSTLGFSPRNSSVTAVKFKEGHVIGTDVVVRDQKTGKTSSLRDITSNLTNEDSNVLEKQKNLEENPRAFGAELKLVSYTDNGNGTHTYNDGTANVRAHSFDREVAADKYISTAATPTEGAVYYKSCICGAASATERFTFGTAAQIHPYGATLCLGNDLGIYFYVKKSVVDLFEDIEFKDEHGKPLERGKNVTVNGIECCEFRYYDINPAKIGDTVKVRISGKQAGGIWLVGEYVSYSVKQYCTNMLSGNTTQELKDLLHDLLNYGAAAQKYIGYNTGALVNRGVETDLETYTWTPNEANIDTTRWASAELILTSGIVTEFTLKSELAAGERVVVYYGRNQQKEAYPTVDGTRVIFGSMAATDFAEDMRIEIQTAGGDVLSTSTYSIGAYAKQLFDDPNNDDAELSALLRAMMKYIRSVEGYFFAGYSDITIDGNKINEYSIMSTWEGVDESYTSSDAQKYAAWLQNKIIEKTGYTLPIVTADSGKTIKINTNTANGTAGVIKVDGDDLVISGGRLASTAGALYEFSKLISADCDFVGNVFSGEFSEAQIIEGLYPTIPNVLPSSTDKRPIPTDFQIGEGGHRGEDGLVYYPLPETADETVAKLTGGESVLTSDSDLFTLSKNNSGDRTVGGFMTDQYMGGTNKWTYVDVTGQSFSKALQITTNEIKASNVRFCPSISDFGSKFTDGDIMLVKMSVRLLDGGYDGEGKLNVSFSKHWQSSQSGGQNYTVSTEPTSEWKSFYLAFTTTHGYISDGFYFDISPAQPNASDSTSYNQVLQIGGIELINYKSAYTMDDMPSNSVIYAGAVEGARWRDDALAKIEQVRMGDIDIIVKDANGNLITDADVSLDMYEHEFDIGLNISHDYLLTDRPDAEKFRETVVENFNSYGTGHLHRKTDDENGQYEYDIAENSYLWAMLNGCAQELKGHALMWDGESSETIPGDNGEYTNPIDYYMQYINAGDWAGLDNAVKAHFEWMSVRFPYITQWDVSNEDSSRNGGSFEWAHLKKEWSKYLDSTYRTEHPSCTDEEAQAYVDAHIYDYLIKWYEYANTYFPDAKLVINDIFDITLQKYNEKQIPFLDWAVENLDFDAIGYQGHEGYSTDPEDVVKILEKLSTYGKEIHITEYNTNAPNGLAVESGISKTDEEANYQANLVRDTLIAYFSCENVTSLYLWWHKDIDGGSGRVLYDYNYNLKKAGMMFQDLFYNQWWTNESGKTNSNGEFSTRGYYGDYTVTVSKNGQTVTKDVQCHKGAENQIVIVLP